jgi:hypothetical protein
MTDQRGEIRRRERIQGPNGEEGSGASAACWERRYREAEERLAASRGAYCRELTRLRAELFRRKDDDESGRPPSRSRRRAEDIYFFGAGVDEGNASIPPPPSSFHSEDSCGRCASSEWNDDGGCALKERLSTCRMLIERQGAPLEKLRARSGLANLRELDAHVRAPVVFCAATLTEKMGGRRA